MNELTSCKNEVNHKTLESLVKNHALMVKRVAYHLYTRLPKTVLLDDLIQAGMLGLLEATIHYDDTKGASFETYAGIRIRGHMMDEVRKNDWVPRSVHRNARAISKAIKSVEQIVGRDAMDIEIAEELGVSLSDYHEMQQNAIGSQIFGFDDLALTDDLISDKSPDISEPHLDALKDDLKKNLSQIISGLSKKEQMVLFLYYNHDLNLKEIGEILEVSESRVSQLHTQAIFRIKAKLYP